MFRNLRIFDDECAYCSHKKIYKYFLCEDCFSNLRRINKNNYNFKYLDEVYICFSYSSLIKEMIRDFKYNDKTYYHKVFGEMNIDMIFRNNLNRAYNKITYISMTKNAKNNRGYNQAELIAKYISKNTLINCEELLFKRVNNKKQENLTAMERYNNVKDVFYCNKELLNENILIIDDIITTGYTLDFAAKALKEKGAKKVAALVTATGDNL